MKVSSPIGDLPFEPRTLKVRGRGLEMQGVMGAWPARVQIDLGDVVPMVRLVAKPLAVLTGVIVLLGLSSKIFRRSGR